MSDQSSEDRARLTAGALTEGNRILYLLAPGFGGQARWYPRGLMTSVQEARDMADPNVHGSSLEALHTTSRRMSAPLRLLSP